MPNRDDFPSAPIRVHSDAEVDLRFHDGGLPHARGVRSYQILRACRDPRFAMDGLGWTYNHAPMLAWWRGSFFVEYLANPRTEHLPPSATLLSHSGDGRSWSAPRVIFPPLEVPAAPYRGPGKALLGETAQCNCHQRMGFYVAADGRLLVSAFYGISPEIHIGPNSGWGVGRVVREIYPDLSLSPIYFLRYNAPGGYTRENTDAFPFFEDSPDPGFVAACREFLGNRLAVQQWWEEQRFDAELFTVPGGAALSYYTLPDGGVIGLYKNGLVIRSDDGGETWTDARPSDSLQANTAKLWGERTADGRYAIVYNPSRNGAHRWPLAVVSGENGLDFDDMLALVPEISPCRYEGGLKNLGAQYMRGIAEHNPRPGDAFLRLVYSVNKEDIWFLEAPLPLTGAETADIDEPLDGEIPPAWNLCVPKWCAVAPGMSGGRNALCLSDRDPYDRPRAERLIAPGARVELGFDAHVETLRPGTALVACFEDARGREALRLLFDADGLLRVKTGGAPREWLRLPAGWTLVRARFDCRRGEAEVALTDAAGHSETRRFAFNQPLRAVARAVFTTKAALPWNTLEDCGKGGMLEDLPDDTPRAETRVAIGGFWAKRLE